MLTVGVRQPKSALGLWPLSALSLTAIGMCPTNQIGATETFAFQPAQCLKTKPPPR